MRKKRSQWSVAQWKHSRFGPEDPGSNPGWSAVIQVDICVKPIIQANDHQNVKIVAVPIL